MMNFRIAGRNNTVRRSRFRLDRLLCLALCGCLFGGCLFGATCAVAADEEIDTQRALESVRRASWYDAEKHAFAPPTISPEHDSEIRRSGRQAEVNPNPPANLWNWNWSVPQFISDLFSWTVLLALGGILLFVLIAVLFYTFRDYLPSGRRQTPTARGIEIDPNRLEDLPFDVGLMSTSSAIDPLAEAQRLIREGNYDLAILYVYGYMLLALDQARKIHLQKGKTNRMYLRELSRGHSGALRRIVESTMLGFEQVYFGKHSITPEYFQTIWSQVDEFHRLIAPAPPTKHGDKLAEVAPA